jgi:hypothetical protein
MSISQREFAVKGKFAVQYESWGLELMKACHSERTTSPHSVMSSAPNSLRNSWDKEWLSLVEAGELTGIKPNALGYRASKGEFVTTKREESRRCIYVHRDELNRFLASLVYKPRRLRDDIQPRVEINYSPIFTGVQSSFIWTSVSIKAFSAG